MTLELKIQVDSLKVSDLQNVMFRMPGRLVTYPSSEEWSDPEMLRQCPFDPVHVVQAYRYQQHILSCRRNPENATQENDREEATGN